MSSLWSLPPRCRHFFIEEKLPSGLIIMREVCERQLAAAAIIELLEKKTKVVEKAHAAAERN